jgi:hypothetical protein
LRLRQMMAVTDAPLARATDNAISLINATFDRFASSSQN